MACAPCLVAVAGTDGLGQTAGECPVILALALGALLGGVAATLVCETRASRRISKASVEAFATGWLRGEALPKRRRR